MEAGTRAPAAGDPWLAVALSVLAPGLGQLHARRPLRATVWFAGTLACGAGILNWIVGETRHSPAEGVVLFAGMFVFEVGSWIDAYRVARRGGPAPAAPHIAPRPSLAAALSVLAPGLGHLYVCVRSLFLRLLLAPVFLLPALVVLAGGSLEPSVVPQVPGFLTAWPILLVAVAGATLSGAAIVHSYVAACRRAGIPARPPRLTTAVWLLALLAWGCGQVPWEACLKTRVKSFRIPSSSMEPVLLVGDRIWARRTPEVNRGDLIVFHPPQDPVADYIKRVIALPGETIRMDGNRVYINGRRLEEPYAVFRGGGSFAPPSRLAPSVVPPDSYFVMGDNRDASYDSRLFGPVKRDRVFGRAYKRFWPPGRSGPLR